ALKSGRPVYAVLTQSQHADFNRWFITGEYEMTQLDHWLEPCGIHFPEEEGGSPKRPNRATPLAPRVMSFHPMINWHPQELSMFEIHHKPATTQPTTRLAT